MDYERGLHSLETLVGTEGDNAWRDFQGYKGRLLENLREDRRFGGNDKLSSDRARVVDELNVLALRLAGVSFVDLCIGDRSSSQRPSPHEPHSAPSVAVDSSPLEAVLVATGAIDFFIGYNKADKGWAEWIAWQLEEDGYTTMLEAWDFSAGSNFVLEMHEAAGARRMMPILSPDYLTARFTQPEWATAFARDPEGEGRLLVPVRVRECTPTGLLAPIVYIDLVGQGEDAARHALLGGVRQRRAKPLASPRFPVDQGKRNDAESPPFPVPADTIDH